MTAKKFYTTRLQAGLGILVETRILLELWQPEMEAPELWRTALNSGRFPQMSARRVRNLVVEAFAPRFLVDKGRPALWLKTLAPHLGQKGFEQLAFVYTCRANAILADFVTEVYWPRYAAGHDLLTNQDAKAFVVRAAQEGRIGKPWSESTVRRVAGYLTGACADFGLLERGAKKVRQVVPHRIEAGTAAALAYELHESGRGDNAVIAAPDWKLFGLHRREILEELKRLALRQIILVQTAGDATRIEWKCKTLKELADAVAQG